MGTKDKSLFKLKAPITRTLVLCQIMEFMIMTFHMLVTPSHVIVCTMLMCHLCDFSHNYDYVIMIMMI